MHNSGQAQVEPSSSRQKLSAPCPVISDAIDATGTRGFKGKLDRVLYPGGYIHCCFPRYIYSHAIHSLKLLPITDKILHTLHIMASHIFP